MNRGTVGESPLKTFRSPQQNLLSTRSTQGNLSHQDEHESLTRDQNSEDRTFELPSEFEPQFITVGQQRPPRVRNAQRRKVARIESRRQRKLLKAVPAVSRMIANSAVTIANQLGSLTALSNSLNPEFLRRADQLETENLKQASSPSVKATLAQSIENLLTTMMVKLQLPRECLTIAYVYMERVLKAMYSSRLFLSPSNAESLTITCLVLAAKFFLETQDVVVNQDIARLLGLSHLTKLPQSTSGDSPSSDSGVTLLNQMEAKLLKVIEFNLFVNLSEYNLVQKGINAEVRSQKQKATKLREGRRPRAGSQVICLASWEGLESVASLFE